MEEKRVEIIKSALEVYMKFGIKSVTMDEMARQLGISKKTLYIHVKDKNELVEQCLLFAQCSDEEGMSVIFNKKLGAIEELLEVGRYLVKTLGAIHPSIFFDLSKYHPSALKLMNKYKNQSVKGLLITNLERGIEQGVYRKNLNPDIMSRLHLAAIDGIMSGDTVPVDKYRIDEVYSEYFRYHIRGIASAKGLEYLKELIKKMKIYKLVAALIIGVSVSQSFGQEGNTTFSLADAEEYGVNNNEKIKNAMLDIEVARKKVWETTAMGLPQVNVEGQFQQLLDIPVSVVDATLFNPAAEPGSVMEFRMGQEFSTSLTLNASQLIFDGSYIVALQFSKFFQKMSSTAAHNTKQEVKALVREAYYNVLVANENVTLMDSILIATKGLWEKTEVFAETGMIPQEDADQVEIAYNRIQASKANALRQADVAMNLLKLQMGYSFDQPLELVERLEDVLAFMNDNSPILTTSTIKENQNYVMLEQQKTLDEYSLKNEQAAYLPSVGAFFTHSQNAYRNEFDFLDDKPWYPTTIWGLSLAIPVTSSGQKIVRVQQAEIKIEQDQNNLNNLEKSLQFQELQLKTSFQTSVEMVELERTSVELARRIYERALIRNTTGVVSALEVTQLQNQLLNAEGSYINAVMNMLSVKVQLDKLYNK